MSPKHHYHKTQPITFLPESPHVIVKKPIVTLVDLLIFVVPVANKRQTPAMDHEEAVMHGVRIDEFDDEEQQVEQRPRHPQPELRRMYGPNGTHVEERESRWDWAKNRHAGEQGNDEKVRFASEMFKVLHGGPLETKEQIESYVGERKRNYPTRDNETMKKQEERERKKRGEVIVTAHDKVKHLLRLVDDLNSNAPVAQPSSSRQNHNYAQPREENTGYQRRKAPDHHRQQYQQQQHKYQTRDEWHEKERHSKQTFQHTKAQDDDSRISKPHKMKQHFEEMQQEENVAEKRTSLIRMLLTSDMERETSVILQCLRYIVSQKFFVKDESELSETIQQRLKQITWLSKRPPVEIIAKDDVAESGNALGLDSEKSIVEQLEEQATQFVNQTETDKIEGEN